MSELSIADSVLYVNAYSISRHYGGPEEGGWWYDVHEPIMSVRVDENDIAPTLHEEDVEDAAKRIKELYVQRFRPMQPKHNRYSMIGGADIVVVIEETFAEFYPKERPRYE